MSLAAEKCHLNQYLTYRLDERRPLQNSSVESPLNYALSGLIYFLLRSQETLLSHSIMAIWSFSGIIHFPVQIQFNLGQT